jgi:Protein of unknown function (DUF1194)
MNAVPPSGVSWGEWLLHSIRALSRSASDYLARMIEQFSAVVFTTVILATSGSAVRAGEQVDLLLVLAADVSYSIAGEQFKLQREGYAHAITSPHVIRVIQSGEIGRIGICYIEWSGEIFQTVVADWTLIGNVGGARRFANKIVEAPRSFAENTSISTAILFATAQIARAPFRSQSRIIDISGDGDNNAGRSVTSARDEAVAKGVTINGLAILNDDMKEHTHPPGGLEDYYRRNVIGGAGAFVMVAENFETFGSALVKKLATEIAGTPQPSFPTASRAATHQSRVLKVPFDVRGVAYE